MAVKSGRVLGRRYRLESRLGKGASGEVWAATDLESGGAVAIKILRESVNDPEVVRRFQKEWEILSQIESAHVVRCLGGGVGPGEKPYVVLELLEGETLQFLLKRKPMLTLQEALPIVEAVLFGLEAAHDANILHRDIKPSNIFLVRATVPAVKILDFGVAKLLGSESTPTTEETILGSFSYMAPEQLGGSVLADARADLYAAATVAFECLAGRVPFHAGDIDVRMALKRDCEPPTLRDVTGVLWPLPAERFFARALANVPASRFASANRMRKAWDSLCALEMPEVARIEPDPHDTTRDMSKGLHSHRR